MYVCIYVSFRNAIAVPMPPAGNIGRFVPDSKAENSSSMKHVVNKKEKNDTSKATEVL